MDSSIILLLQIVGACSGLVLVAYVLYRLVLAARKAGWAGRGEEIVAPIVLLFGPVIAPTPPREVSTESRELKREQDESGDPLDLNAD